MTKDRSADLGSIERSARQPYNFVLLNDSRDADADPDADGKPALRRERSPDNPEPSGPTAFVRRRTAVLLIFFLSGAAGLVYEIVWARQLLLVFGNTTQAISTILTGFFGGMAIGSIFGGRLADRVRSPLRIYGLAEVVLSAIAVATPVFFRLLHEVYRSAYASLESAPVAVALIRFGLALAVLAPATILMGATLPMLSRDLARRRSELGAAFGRLYAANTFGAILGATLAGFVLIELMGLSGTLWAGALCSLIAGVLAFALAGRGASVALPIPDRALGAEDVRSPRPARLLALTAAFVSGLTSLGYQVLWTRLLSSGTGNTTYVFTFILTTFLLGIAIGATAVSASPPRGGHAVALGATQIAVAVVAVLGAALAGGYFLRVSFAQAVLLSVFPATLLLGLVLPLASGLVATADKSIGRDAGLLLGVNTAGVILGTFAIPFALVPAIGSPRSIVALALVNALFGAVLLWTARRRDGGPFVRLRVVGAVVGVLVAAVFVLRPPFVVDPGETYVRRNGFLYASAEDQIASVQAGQMGSKRLWVAGTGMTVLTVDARLMALLPIVLRPDSESMLNIGFGMGATYRSALIAGLRVDSVELVPSVPKMFDYYFSDGSRFFSDPRGRLLIADGRNYLELTTRRYDLITVDPPPPIRSSGTGILYSREFYAAAASRLTARGLMMQWIPYDQSIDEFCAHVRTFIDVFPEVTIAFGPGGHGAFMFGAKEPMAFEELTIRSVLARPGVMDDLREPIDSPASTLEEWIQVIPRLVWLSGREVAGFAGRGGIITDDRPRTEYFLLRSLFGRRSPPMNTASLRAARDHR